ncbi:MSHA biogenesis protein MshK [Vibrio rumoiensis]|uniref:MSHA biogenesis protein MshK n=1 Tax=Vibrio rumoiensis TaxID=76258 RepID=UPI003AA7C621
MVRTLILSLLLLMSGNVLAQDDDPTAPLDWMTGKVPAKSGPVYYRVPSLQSIVCNDGGQCRAILNNKIVSKGESVSGYRVADISREYVTLTRGSKTWNLELFSQIKY